MAEQLKFMYNKKLVDRLANSLYSADKNFNPIQFKKDVFNHQWDDFELKQRTNHIAELFDKHLNYDFKKQVEILLQVAPHFNGFTGTVFPTFIELFGIDSPEVSIPALKKLTAYSTSEFAIRPFILKYPDTIETMLTWSTDENYHVRRLASEGCRPLLPWAIKLVQFVEDPSPIIPILNNLRNDSEDYVYRSVANNLNDISKHHPALVLKLCKAWINESKTTKWVAKHALRTLLKKGNSEAMQLFGFGAIDQFKIERFDLVDDAIKIGADTRFELKIRNSNKKAKVRLEYSISYLRKNGQHNDKVFQISELELNNNESFETSKSISFKELTTRKHYPGQHFITLKLNGNPTVKIPFELL